MLKMVIVKDVIYRFVEISDFFKKIIDTPEFNRLRRIKQLGLACYVYPSANHTRFEHSIGVFYLAGKVCDKLGSENVSEREKVLVQTAALLHDIGHVSFSHLTDYILEEKKVDEKIAKHEYRSIALLEKINNRLRIFSENEIQSISDMILGNFKNKDKPFLFQIVSNKLFGLDVDRLDYLQRDMYYTGMHCFQSDYILECLTLKEGNLAVFKKGVSEIEMMYEARKRLLTLVCRHKTVLKIEYILRQCLEKLNLTEESFISDWEKLDDYKMTVCIIEKCPELFAFIENRNLKNVPDLSSEKFKHIKLIYRNDIENEIKKTIWV